MQAYAFYYAFSAILFVFIVIERVLNACATLLVRLIWGTHSASSQALLHSSSVAPAGSNFELFGAILEHITHELDVRDGDFDPGVHHALDVHTSQWLHNTSSDVK